MFSFSRAFSKFNQVTESCIQKTPTEPSLVSTSHDQVTNYFFKGSVHSTMARKFGIPDASEKFWFGENCLYVLYVCPSVYPSIQMTVHPHGCDNDHLINTEGQSN